MSEDTPVNTGVSWPPEFEAGLLVRRMQVKLHRWAVADRYRRFHDLFNLVSDPAFLTVAWQRVSTNAGARTPGVRAAPPPSRALRVASDGHNPAALDLGASASLSGRGSLGRPVACPHDVRTAAPVTRHAKSRDCVKVALTNCRVLSSIQMLGHAP
jgi:hypothetical protein